MYTEKLKAIRKQLDLTQEQMAGFIGCSYISYQRYEQGARPIPRYVSKFVVALSLIARKKQLEDLKRLWKTHC
jgi:transcriptional regulator with XRE-family HTH domain